MLAQQDNIFLETGQTIFRQNQDEQVRYWCEAIEEGERIARTIEHQHKKELEERDGIIAKQRTALVEKDTALAEKDATLAEQEEVIAQLQAELRRLKETDKSITQN